MSSGTTRTYQFTYDRVGVPGDLKECRRKDEYAYRRIIAILERLIEQPGESEKFITENWQDDVIEDVGLIRTLQRERINGLRVKFWDIKKWRLLFIADHRLRQVGLVAVMHRDQDYESDKVLWDRIKNAVDRFNFGRY